MLCPNCRQEIDERTLTCAAGHHFELEDGVLALLADDFGRRLRVFTETFKQIRADEGMRLLDDALYDQLPQAEVVGHKHEWRLRRYDWEVVHRLVAKRGEHQRILDVGAWNGWLSNRLVELGHEVTAVDYFADPYDGLGAMQFYPRRWRAIQMDLRDLALLDERFDVVVLNRCTHFFENPAGFAQQARQQLAPGGLLLMTGLPFYRAVDHKIEQMRRLRAKLQRYGTDYFKPVRGYLDTGDRARLLELGVALRPYRQLWPSNLKARWLAKRKPYYLYGCWPEGET